MNQNTMKQDDIIYSILSTASKIPQNQLISNVSALSPKALGIPDLQWHRAVLQITAEHYMEGLYSRLSVNQTVAYAARSNIGITGGGYAYLELKRPKRLKNTALKVFRHTKTFVSICTVITTIIKLIIFIKSFF